jgi:LysM repeat protein
MTADEPQRPRAAHARPTRGRPSERLGRPSRGAPVRERHAEPATAPESLEAPPPGGNGRVATICPYLVGASGSWVASRATRDHRCAAVAPAAALAIDKQRRLCLTPEHVGCATFQAAAGAASTRSGTRPAVPGWGWTRTTPVVDASVGIGSAITAVVADRRVWQVVPALVLVAALAALGLSNLGNGRSTTGGVPTASVPVVAVASPSPAATAAEPTSTPAPTPAPTPTAEPSSTPAPTATVEPTATPAPSAQAQHIVKSGDTLYDIARFYGTTVTAIKNLNGLTSNTLHVGQVLLIP